MALTYPIGAPGVLHAVTGYVAREQRQPGVPPSYPSPPSYPLLSECPRGYGVPTPPDPAKAKTHRHHIWEGR
jgi:hypothetical protein